MRIKAIMWILILIIISSLSFSDDTGGKWIFPDGIKDTDPYWGIKDGIGISCPPHKGVVRGLLGIHTPYLGHKPDRVLNYIAIEPVVDNQRSYSELEISKIDNKQGLKIRTSDKFIPDYSINMLSDIPAKGIIEEKDGIQTLTFYIYIETLANGSKPIIQVILSDNKPYEIAFRIFAAKDSKPFRTCILTATMGNYAQLRYLWLKGEIIEAKNLWPDFSEKDIGFAPHKQWHADSILKLDSGAYTACTTSIISSDSVKHDEKIPWWWKYEGKIATQYWRVPNPTKDLIVRVNGRTNYYGMSEGRIPGGIAFENFEVEEPFVSGQEFIFGATTVKPDKKLFQIPENPTEKNAK